MKQFKQAAMTLAMVALAMVGMLLAQAHASEAQNLRAAQPIAAFSQTDIDAMFVQTGQPMQLATLSQQEMHETEGAVAPIVVYGLMVGSRVAYVGMTNSLRNRTAQHTATRAFSSVRELGTSPTRAGARVIEQNFINRFNTINNGWNRINSISPRNPLSRQVTVPYRR